MVHMVQCDKPAAASEGTPVSSQWQRAGTLGLLTLCYTLGELGHFLEGVRFVVCAIGFASLLVQQRTFCSGAGFVEAW